MLFQSYGLIPNNDYCRTKRVKRVRIDEMWKEKEPLCATEGEVNLTFISSSAMLRTRLVEEDAGMCLLFHCGEGSTSTPLCF